MTREAKFCPQCGIQLEQREYHDRLRPVCPDCGHVVYFDPKVAVVVFIEQTEKVLLIQRGNEPGKGKWAMPAGFVEWDEAPEAAAIRETWEETGLHVQVIQLMDVFPKKDHGLADIVIAYRAHIIGGTLQAGDDAVNVGWFGRDELPELVFYPSQTIVGDRWLNRLL